jgi:hypothetical protein
VEAFIKIRARSNQGVNFLLKHSGGANVLGSEVTMIKKLLLVLTAVGMLAFAAQPAHAGVHIGIGIGGGGYYAPGPYYGYPYSGYYGPYPPYGVYYGPGYYPWYSGYWGGGYYRGYHGYYGHGGGYYGRGYYGHGHR